MIDLWGTGLSFEAKFLIIAALIAVISLINGITLIQRKYRPLKGGEFWKRLGKRWRRTVRKRIRFLLPLRKRKLAIFNLLAAPATVLLAAATFSTRPVIASSSPTGDSFMFEGDQVIELEFSAPVDTGAIQFNLSPEIAGQWEFEPAIPGLPFKRKAKFYPEESIFPERRVVVYVTGLRSWWSRGKLHEDGVSFFSPKIPNIEAVIPDDGSEQVSVDQDLKIQYDAPVGRFVNIEYKISPEIAFELGYEANPGNTHEIKFAEPLKQDQEYTIKVYRTPRSYETGTGNDVEVGATEEIRTSRFKTVTTPHISAYEPKGISVHADATIKITFDQEMDRESVEARLSIGPEILGDISWEDDRTFLLTPRSELEKEREYEIVFRKGIATKYGGTTEEDIRISFATIGRVTVIGFSPVSGSQQLSPATTNIVVEFSQEVDHASAQQHFSISPAVSGGFGWEGNKMIYYTAGHLSYATRYDVKVSAGVKTIYGLDSTENFNAYFTTRNRVFALAVPQYYQQLPEGQFDCNLTAARMALAYRKIYVTDAQIRSAIGTGEDPNVNWVPGYGVHPEPIANYIRSQGRSATIKRGWNLAELIEEIENGNPVILWWYNRYSQQPGSFSLSGGYTGYKGMHSEVVRGFIGESNDPIYLLTNDPWRGQLTYGRALFLSTWAFMNYTAIVVY